MDKAVNFIDKYMNGGNSDDDQDEDIKVEDVTIPKGFYYVGGTKEGGIVISDAKEDENKYKEQTEEGNSQIPGDGLVGNQFVWVPVENAQDFIRYPSYIYGELQSIDNDYEPVTVMGYQGEEEEEYNLMKQSVERNKGFYVARYEAGKEIIDDREVVVSKKNVDVWNNIYWGDGYYEKGTKGAVAKAQGMYTDKTKYAVTSTLIYGIQWDAIMAWIDPNYKTSNCSNDSYVVTSSNKGNYNMAKVIKTGTNDEYRIKNIYDLAGNVLEWTMEMSTADERVPRGGNYYGPESASSRYVQTPWRDGEDTLGLRVALYI